MAARGFLKLLEYAEKALKSGSGGQDSDRQKDVWSGVAFRLLGSNFVARMGEVVEVLSIPRYTVVPGVQDWMRGVSNVRGRLLPIMDLPVYFGAESRVHDSRRRVLVVDMHEIFSGLVVEEVFGIQHFPFLDYSAEPIQDIPSALTPYVEGMFWKDGQFWSIFNMGRLIQEPRFVQASAA